MAAPIDHVSDHSLIQVKLEAVIIEREQPLQQDPGDVDLRSLPQTTIRKVIKECVDQGLFDTTPEIAKHPLIDLIPQDIANHFRPQTKKNARQTIRYSPAQKAHETPEMLQMAGELNTTRCWTSCRGT